MNLQEIITAVRKADLSGDKKTYVEIEDLVTLINEVQLLTTTVQQLRKDKTAWENRYAALLAESLTQKPYHELGTYLSLTT